MDIDDMVSICKKHEAEFQAGRITADQLCVEMAYALLEVIDDLRFRQEPTPPQVVVDYRLSSKDQRDKAAEKGFWREGAQAAWLAQSREIWSLNRGNYEVLTDLARAIPDDDIVAQQKIRSYLNGFDVFIHNENKRLGVHEQQEESGYGQTASIYAE